MDCCFTDPPWNVAIGQDSNPRHRQRTGLTNDNLPADQFRELLHQWARTLTPHLRGDLYCVLGAAEWPTLDLALRAAGFHWSATIIWVKDRFVLGRSKFHRRYEPIWYGWHRTNRSSHQGARDADDVWTHQRPARSELHPTMKPVSLVEQAIQHSTPTDGTIIDPFLGAGSTLIAAHRTNRRCYGIEIDPTYVDVAVQRWAEHTGQTPERNPT